jgi:hypothetical protein
MMIFLENTRRGNIFSPQPTWSLPQQLNFTVMVGNLPQMMGKHMAWLCANKTLLKKADEARCDPVVESATQPFTLSLTHIATHFALCSPSGGPVTPRFSVSFLVIV